MTDPDEPGPGPHTSPSVDLFGETLPDGPPTVREEAASPRFEEVMERLEAIVRRLEQEQPSLEEALSLFEEGAELSKIGERILSAAEARVEKVLGLREDGSPVTEPLDPIA